MPKSGSPKFSTTMHCLGRPESRRFINIYREATKKDFGARVFIKALTSGMKSISNTLFSNVVRNHDSASGAFWFILSMAMITGLWLTYPIN